MAAYLMHLENLYKGDIAFDIQPTTIVTEKVTVSSLADVPYPGDAVLFNTATEGVQKYTVPTTDALVFHGVATRPFPTEYGSTYEYRGNEYTIPIVDGDLVSIMTRGAVCVELKGATDAVKKGKVYYNVAGKFFTADNTDVEIANAEFLTSGAIDTNVSILLK